MLGVFQKLIASKANDAYGFMLLRGIVESLPLAAYQQYMPTVWQLLFTRLQVSWCWWWWVGLLGLLVVFFFSCRCLESASNNAL